MTVIVYKIADNDPDIIMMKEVFGDDLDVFHPRHKRKHLPGSEQETWNNIELFSGNLLNKYLNHCTTQCKYMLEWRGNNFDEVINLIPKLHEESKHDRELKENLAFTLKQTKILESGELDNDLAAILNLNPLDTAVMSCSSAWTALAAYCSNRGVLDRVTNISSDSLVRKHHFLAVAAMHVITYVRTTYRLNDIHAPTQFLPLIYLLIQDAEKAQQEWSGKVKTRLVLSPDAFLLRQMAGGKKSNLFRDQIKHVFLKGWLYHVTSGDENFSQTQLLYSIQHELGVDESESTLKRWLKKIREPGRLLAEYADEDTNELTEL